LPPAPKLLNGQFAADYFGFPVNAAFERVSQNIFYRIACNSRPPCLKQSSAPEVFQQLNFLPEFKCLEGRRCL